MRTRVSLTAAALATIVAATGLQAQTREYSCAVTRLAENDAIKVDGNLDETAWKDAVLLGPLTQVEPVEGVPPSRKTAVRIAYDDNYLYLAIKCFDDPDLVRARLMTRDARLDPDDRVEFWVDTFNDKRFAFWFQIGAGGSLGDALIAGNGDRFNKSWDGIWYGRSRVTHEGWQAEVALPFKTLAFKDGNGTWGFNLTRHRKETNEEMRWASPLVAYRFFRVSQGGTLTGLEGMEHGLGLDVVPYLKGSASRDRRVRDHISMKGEFGGEVYYRLSPELRLVLTYNTDFAETEVDERQVNLTRFPLFFPEKRDFFLEDSGLFEFGLPSSFRRGGGRTPLPFFSRRIGLDSEGREVPIITGAKLAGRVADWNVGALGTLTDRFTNNEEKGLGVVRVSRNLGAESSVGMIATAGRPEGDGSSYTGGVDFKYGNSDLFGPGRALRVWGYLMGTSSAGPGGDGGAWGGRAEYRSSEWYHRAQALGTGSEFDPQLGFVRRSGQREYSWTSSLTHRGGGFIKEARLRLSPVYRTFTSGRTESWEVELNWVDLEFETGDRFDIESRREFARLPESFEIHDGIDVPAGDYTTTTHEVSVSTSDRRVVSAGGSVEYGQLYSGHLTRLSGRASIRPNPFVAAQAEYQEFRVSLDQGAFKARVYEGRLDLGLSPDVSLRNLVQYDTDSKNLTVQSRFRWTIEPGSDLFLLGVWGWEKTTHIAPLAPTTQDVTVKIVYTLRF